MSASVYWDYVKSGHSLGVSAPSSFIAAMTRVFGEPPWTLDSSDVSILRGMASVSENPSYAKLLELLTTGEDTGLTVWVVW